MPVSSVIAAGLCWHRGPQMAPSLLLILMTFAVRQLAASAQKDCPVLVTGPEQQWTAARPLERISAAPSMDHQLPGRPRGRTELSFSVQTALSHLEIQLSSTGHLGSYLLSVDADGWRAERVFVGATHTLLSSGPAPPGRVAAADQWSSYAVSVHPPDTVRLQRLHANGSRQLWVEMRHPEALSVDLASLRVTTPSSQLQLFGRSSSIGPVASGQWGFWKFDCSAFYYPTAELCHLWPSWRSDVPLKFRTLNRSIRPVTYVNVYISTAGASELYLYETTEHYYVVTVTPSRLTLGRRERGVPVTRQVEHVCLVPQPSPPPLRLLWVSILRGIINVGVEGVQPCGEDDVAATSDATVDQLNDREMITVDPSPGSEEVSEITTVVTEVTTGQPTTSTPVPARTPLITWQDGGFYSVASYGVRTPDDQGVWTVNCQPSPDPTTDRKMDKRPTEVTLDPSNTGYPSQQDHAERCGGGRDCRAQQPFLLATVVLAVTSVVLLLVAVLLVTALVRQRRRWAAELAAERRLSLVGTDLFGAAPIPTVGENEYAEVHLYERVRPMSVQPGESTFKPTRRQPMPVAPPETKLDEVPVFEGVSDSREASMEPPLPPQPEDII